MWRLPPGTFHRFMRAFDHELGRRKGWEDGYGCGRNKAIGQGHEKQRSQVAQAPNQTRQPKDDERDTSRGAINKCGFGKGLKRFTTNTFLVDYSLISAAGEGCFVSRSCQTSVCQCFAVRQVHKSSRETENRSGAQCKYPDT